MSRQRAVKAHGIIELCEAERVKAPRVLRGVAGSNVVMPGARESGANGLDEAALEARVSGLDVLLRLVLVPLEKRTVDGTSVIRKRSSMFVPA